MTKDIDEINTHTRNEIQSIE